jgi:hypothetical protein
MEMKMKMKKWKVDETTKYFINLKLEKENQDIVDFRRRWKLGDKGLKDGNYYSAWVEKLEKECQNLRRPIRISELEAYFDIPDIPLARPILSSELEGRLREENLGDSFPAVFKMELRGLGKKIGIPAEHDLCLEHFITYNVVNFDLVFNHGIKTSIKYRINEEFGLIGENICLILGQNTGSEDLDNLWKREIKPRLKNLLERTRDKERKSKNAPILEEMTKKKTEDEEMKKYFKNRRVPNEHRERDRDIALVTMKEKEIDRLYSRNSPKNEKQINKTLGKKVQNIRHYRSKRHPL